MAAYSKGNPDKGPQAHWGAHKFDKGYMSDMELSKGAYPKAMERGNDYSRLQDEIAARDAKKLKRNEFSKIA